MRASFILAAICLLFASVTANDQILRGRALHTSPEDTKSTKGFTKVFCMSHECHAEPAEFEGGHLIGLIVGFVVTAGFMLFGVIVIIKDEIDRHGKYAQQLIDDRIKLRAAGATDADIAAYDREFFERENAKKKTAAELEKERLELMAKN